MSRGVHWDQLVPRDAGTTVGRFTERASPGMNADGTGVPPLPPDVDAFATKMGMTPEQKANLARRRAQQR